MTASSYMLGLLVAIALNLYLSRGKSRKEQIVGVFMSSIIYAILVTILSFIGGN